MDKNTPVKPDSHVVKRPERSKFYYFRMEIPKDVRGFFGGKREYEKSLKTADVREANRLAAPIRAEVYKQVDAARKSKLSPDELPLDAIGQAWKRQVLAEDEERRSSGMCESTHEALGEGLQLEKPEVAKGLALGRTPDYLKETFSEFLAANGLNAPEGDAARAKLEYRLLQVHSEVLRGLSKRQQGEYVPTPEAAAVPEVVSTHGLRVLLDKYQLESKLTPKDFKDAKHKVESFIAICGELPIRKYTKQHGIQFKEALLARELSARTINSKYLGFVNALFNWAAGNDYIDVNLIASIKVAGVGKVKKAARLPYNPDELTTIFNSVVYTGGSVPVGGKGHAAFWLPLLGLFTGARLEEIAQLQPSDIEKDTRGYFLWITDFNEGTAVKTIESRRRVPLHPELLRIGFIEYWQSVSGKPLLFPLLTEDSKGDISGHWSKWWGRWCRQTLGITDTRKVFHSFRHGFKHMCREAGISEAEHDALTGHAGGTVSRNYKDTFYPLAPLFEAIPKLVAPVDLSGVKWRGDGK